MTSWFSFTDKTEEKELAEHLVDTNDAHQAEKSSHHDEWFDDIVEGSDSSATTTQIMSSLWSQISGENMIQRILSRQNRHAGKMWGKLCHRCDVAYPPPNQLSVVDMFDANNGVVVSELRYAIRHAVAAYPPSFVVVLGLKSDASYALKSTKSLLLSVFGIAKEDVIVDQCSNTLIASASATHQPSFYLCVDHEKRKIVVSIRGSSSIADALTDVNAQAKKYSAHGIDGYVHEGLLAAARNVFDRITAPLLKVCNEHSNYQALITGHSLGAGVAALLGLMYAQHPVLCKQNQLKVFAFASPCIVSHEFTSTQLCESYITSVALSTDIVTRLSIESVKQSNCRLDIIQNASQHVIRDCMLNLADGGYEEHDADEHKEEIKNAMQFIGDLRTAKTPNAQERLFPLGKILWFVPKAAMDEDTCRRRRILMCLKDNVGTNAVVVPSKPEDADTNSKEKDEEEEEKEKQKTKENEVVNKSTQRTRRKSLTETVNTTWSAVIKSFEPSGKEYKTHNTKDSSWTDIALTTWHNLTKGFEEFQETMDKSILNSGGTKFIQEYDGSHYILCEATDCRSIFQELVVDLPESFVCHLPNRYLYACDAHLTRGSLYDLDKK